MSRSLFELLETFFYLADSTLLRTSSQLEILHSKIALPNLKAALRILHISDLHLSKRSDPKFLNHLLRSSISLKPDLILFTGDFVNAGVVENRDHLRELLSSLKAPLGCFAVLGNHDYQEKIPSDLLLTILKESNVTLLQNCSIDIGPLILSGVSEILADDLDSSALLALQQDKPTLLLIHNPDGLKEVPSSLYSSFFAGHTHGGQINVPLIWNWFTKLEDPSLKRGALSFRDKKGFVSRGVGSSFPFRFRSKPEIRLIVAEGTSS